MLSCDEAVRRLWSYLEDELDEVDGARVDDHLSLCRRCCGEAEFAAALSELLRCVPAPELPADVDRRLTGVLEALERGAP